MSTDDAAWVPESCTLPSADQPLRVAEFDSLLAGSLREQQRLTPTRLRWLLDPSAETRTRDLSRRETSCCSFFAFSVTATDQGLEVGVQVSDAHVSVLDRLQERATARSSVALTGGRRPGAGHVH